MARATKKKVELTLEERLEQAIIPVEECPYRLPENWCWARIGTVSNLYTGNSINETIKKKKYYGQSEGLIYIATKDIAFDGTINYETNVRINDYEKYKMAPANTALLCIEGGSAGRKIGFVNQTVCFVNKLCAFVTKEFDSKFIYYYLLSQSFLDEFNIRKHGLIGGVSVKELSSIPIPTPPLPEQKRIVDCIESLFAKLDEAKEKAQAVVDGFEDRKAAILHKAFTGELTAKWRRTHYYSVIGFYHSIQEKLSKSKKKKSKIIQNDYASVLQKSIPSEWMLVNLDSISRLITDGEHKTPKRVDSFCGFYLLSARNILNDSIRLDDVDYVDSEEFKKISKRCNPKKGDLLLSCSGSVGRCCVIDDDNEYCMVRSAAMISQEGCNSRYLMYMIQSDAVQEQISRLSKQTAQANLFLGAIASLVVPLPSREEQDVITNILDSLIDKMKQAREAAEQVIDQIDLMKKSILARAFRGELGTNDPNDESAVELLKSVL